jgi:hypothetical protein
MLSAGQPLEPFLLRESGLPGPRANLELVQAVADEAPAELLSRWIATPLPDDSSESAAEFLVVCGLVGLGRLLAGGDRKPLRELRLFASSPHWRPREGVAMALQRWGDADVHALFGEMEAWAQGGPLEQRAAVAALCEPRLLRDGSVARSALALLDGVTTSLVRREDRRDKGVRVLRQALGYCWSVAVVACPAAGKPALERWLETRDRDVQWVVRENLKKARLQRMDAEWVDRCAARLAELALDSAGGSD